MHRTEIDKLTILEFAYLTASETQTITFVKQSASSLPPRFVCVGRKQSCAKIQTMVPLAPSDV
jgi:hypothetical protein